MNLLFLIKLLLFLLFKKKKKLKLIECFGLWQVKCGCFYTVQMQKTGPSVRYLGPRFQNFLWIITADGISSHVTLFSAQQPVGPSLKEAGSFSLVEVKVTCTEFSPATQMRFDNNDDLPADKIKGDLVWLGTQSRRYLPFFIIYYLLLCLLSLRQFFFWNFFLKFLKKNLILTDFDLKKPHFFTEYLFR